MSQYCPTSQTPVATPDLQAARLHSPPWSQTHRQTHRIQIRYHQWKGM